MNERELKELDKIRDVHYNNAINQVGRTASMILLIGIAATILIGLGCLAGMACKIWICWLIS